MLIDTCGPPDSDPKRPKNNKKFQQANATAIRVCCDGLLIHPKIDKPIMWQKLTQRVKLTTLFTITVTRNMIKGKSRDS